MDKKTGLKYAISFAVLSLIFLSLLPGPEVSATEGFLEYEDFGSKTGSSTHDWTATDGAVGCEFNASVSLSSDTLLAHSITAYIKTTDTSPIDMKGAIYNSSDLSLIAETPLVSVTTPQYYTFTFATPQTIYKNDNYTLVIWGSNKLVTYYASTSSDQTNEDDTAVWDTFGDPFTEDNAHAETQRFYCTVSEPYIYQYTLYGLYDETTGNRAGAITVTAHYEVGSPETFEVDGEYEFGSDEVPRYFRYNLTDEGLMREYWTTEAENNTNIYLFNNTELTAYTIVFYDLAGVLQDSSIIEAQRGVNGTMHVIERRRVDEERKVLMGLRTYELYTLRILQASDGADYTWGDLRLTETVSITLTLKGVEFPKETLLMYSNVFIYAERTFGSPSSGNITCYYEDTLEETLGIDFDVNYKNGTNVYHVDGVANTFSHTWTNADNLTDYALVITINHTSYGVYTWRQYFPREAYSGMPWSLDWLGELPFESAYLLPSFLVVCVAGCFSVLNAELGAFLTVLMASMLAYIGWLPIPFATLIVAFALALLMAFEYAKRRSI